MDESSAIAQPFVEIYENYYRELNPGGSPTISAGEAANFLRRSGLPVQTLGQVWEIADFQKRGVLDKRGTFMAFKLVAAAQQGHPVHVSSLQVVGLNPPNFGGVRTGTPLSHHSPSHQMPPQWGISPADQNKYDSIFDSLVPENGKLSGNKVRPVLLNSGLNPQYLAKIWELSDQDKDVYRALQNEPILSQLPPSLIHPTKAHLSRRQSTVDSFQQNGTLRSRAGSMASLDGINQSSIMGYGDRSVSAQPYQHRASLTSTPSYNLATPSDEWPVDKFGCTAQFSACDTDSDGLVNGVDVRPVLMSTGLPQQYLAHIWELADINKTGVLNQEQFALIIHLVNMRMRGEDLPMQLPGHLVPPSLRQLNLTGGGATVEAESTVSAATLAQAAQSDNPEMRQLVEEMEKLMEERKEADTQVLQLESDMTAKNSGIRNLQIELQTLQGTVKQLERQKNEAQRRLGDLDEQIRQLEAAGVAQSAKGAEAAERLAQLKTDSEEGAASAERDQATISSVNAELAQLEAEARSLQASLATEQREFEAAVDEMTRSERELDRGTRNIVQLAKETESVQQAMVELQQINSAEDAGEKIKEKMHLLSISEKPQLLSDSAFVTPSTSAQSGFQQPPDPFSGQQNRPAPDPFANADPFSGGSGFSSAFPNDPFTSSAFSNNGPAGGNKPPPPRPVPPKAAQNRATSVAEDPFANTDPFAGQTVPAAGGPGFADFANFGSFN